MREGAFDRLPHRAPKAAVEVVIHPEPDLPGGMRLRRSLTLRREPGQVLGLNAVARSWIASHVVKVRTILALEATAMLRRSLLSLTCALALTCAAPSPAAAHGWRYGYGYPAYGYPSYGYRPHYRPSYRPYYPYGYGHGGAVVVTKRIYVVPGYGHHHHPGGWGDGGDGW
jgi:hypothetical protein